MEQVFEIIALSGLILGVIGGHRLNTWWGKLIGWGGLLMCYGGCTVLYLAR